MVSEKPIPNSKSSSRHAIFLFIGQAGCQIGSAFWTLLNEEHGVLPDGSGVPYCSETCPKINFYKDSIFYKDDEFHRSFCYFEIDETSKFVPRNLFIDLEPMVIDEIKTGVFRKLFSDDLNYFEFTKMGDGSTIFPRAYNTIGRFIITNIMNSVRHLVERTDQLNVFNISRSYGGGTGSGIGSLVLENLQEDYPKILISETNVLNSDLRDSPTLEPYNTLFAIESSCMCSGITFLYNNRALQKLCFKRLNIKQPFFITLNQLISYSVSGIYSTERFPGYGNCNLDSMLTNLIPYPRIQFPICTLAPISRKDVIRYEKYVNPSDLIEKVISNDHVMFDLDLETGAYISCCMIYRGLVSPGGIAQSNYELIRSNKIKFIEWSPSNIKNGHSPLSLMDLPNFDFGVSQLSMIMLANHTNIDNAFSQQTQSVHIMLKKKAFLHWFYDYGMEEEDFKDALENLDLLTLDYKEIGSHPEIDSPQNREGKHKRKVKHPETSLVENSYRKNKRKAKTLNAKKADMLYNKPSFTEDLSDTIIITDELLLKSALKVDSEMSSDDVDKLTKIEDDISKTNIERSEIDDSKKLISKSEKTETYKKYKLAKKSVQDNATKKENIKSKRNQTYTNISHLKTYEESFIGNITPNQSMQNFEFYQKPIDPGSNKGYTALEKVKPISDEVVSKLGKRHNVAMASFETKKQNIGNVVVYVNQIHCSLSLARTYEEWYFKKILPKPTPTCTG